MQVIHYTDATCPYAFSAEPHRQQLRWHYGDQLDVHTRQVGLATSADEVAAKGLTVELIERGMTSLQATYGMPIDITRRARLTASVPAARIIVATRLHAPEREAAVQRAFRVRIMGGELADERATLDGAALDAGLDLAEVATWLDDPRTADALAEDMAAARDPHPAALVLNHKLADAGTPAGGRRYTCPSYVFEHGGRTTVVAGFVPWEAYDAAVANTDPTVERRPAPSSAEQVLEWADESLATAEVAALLGVSIDAARTQLEQAGATFRPVGADGYWLA